MRRRQGTNISKVNWHQKAGSNFSMLRWSLGKSNMPKLQDLISLETALDHLLILASFQDSLMCFRALRNLYIFAVIGIGGRLNKLPNCSPGDLVLCSVKKWKPERRKKVLKAGDLTETWATWPHGWDIEEHPEHSEHSSKSHEKWHGQGIVIFEYFWTIMSICMIPEILLWSVWLGFSLRVWWFGRRRRGDDARASLCTLRTLLALDPR